MLGRTFWQHIFIVVNNNLRQTVLSVLRNTFRMKEDNLYVHVFKAC